MPDQLAPKSAVLVVKEILEFISRFQNPPTPEVYEVWYQYTNKLNKPLVDALDYAIREGRPVDVELIQSLRQQYCVAFDEKTTEVQAQLESELVNLQSVVTVHKDAGTTFADSIREISQTMDRAAPSTETLSGFVSNLNDASNKMSKQLDVVMKRLEESESNVASLKQELAESQRAMMTDPLTGLGNRRYFDTLLRKVVQSNSSEDEVNCLAIMDCDKFKVINDTFGHDVGDRVISYIAYKIKKLLPMADPIRLGGDEYALIFRVDRLSVTVSHLEDFRQSITATPMIFADTGQEIGKVSLSIGIAILRDSDDEGSWTQRADKFLYEAKKQGGNRVAAERDIR